MAALRQRKRDSPFASLPSFVCVDRRYIGVTAYPDRGGMGGEQLTFCIQSLQMLTGFLASTCQCLLECTQDQLLW